VCICTFLCKPIVSVVRPSCYFCCKCWHEASQQLSAAFPSLLRFIAPVRLWFAGPPPGYRPSKRHLFLLPTLLGQAALLHRVLVAAGRAYFRGTVAGRANVVWVSGRLPLPVSLPTAECGAERIRCGWDRRGALQDFEQQVMVSHAAFQAYYGPLVYRPSSQCRISGACPVSATSNRSPCSPRSPTD